MADQTINGNLSRVPLRQTPMNGAVSSGMARPYDEVVSNGDLASRLRTVRMSPAAGTRPLEQSRSYQGLDNVIRELESHGYRVKEKIIAHRDTASNEAAYCKAVNKMGQTCFIEVDDDKAVMGVNPRDLSAYEMRDASVIPLATKLGTLECAGSDVVGVALVCESSVCMITRKEHNEPVERTFIFGESRPERMAQIGDNPVAYPIVRLSEIRASPEAVMQIISAATARIRRMAREEVEKQFAQSQLAAKELYNKVAEAHGKFEKYMNQLDTDVTKMESWNMAYLKKPPCKDSEMAKFAELQVCLHAHHNLVIDELRAAVAANDQRAIMVQCIADLQAIIDYMDRAYAEVKS